MQPIFFLALALASPSEDSLRVAEIIAGKALVLWEEGSFVPAAEAFLEAYELSLEPTQLRNAAKAYESGGATELARDAWKRLLALDDVEASDRAEAEEHLAALDAPKPAQPIETPEPAETVAPPEPDPPPPPIAPIVAPKPPVAIVETTPIEAPVRWQPWVLTGAGAVAAIVGGVLLFRAQQDLGVLQDQLAIKENG